MIWSQPLGILTMGENINKTTFGLPQSVEYPVGRVDMNFLQYEFDANPQNTIQVTLDQQANVRIMDYSNLQKYKAGQQHRYYGGLAKNSPISLRVPHQGHWYLIVDLGGYAGTVRASVRVL